MHGRTYLDGTIGRFYKNTYRVIIDDYILPFVYDVHGRTHSFVLKDENSGPRRALFIAKYLENDGLQRNLI